MRTPGNFVLETTWQDRPRRALVHVPPAIESGPLPVMLVFHGSGTHAAAMREFCGLDAKADEAGFIVVYPDGTGRVDHARTWNAGECCGHARHQKSDDVAFVRHLLDRLEAESSVDPQRIHAVGMSNGGMMAYRLAAEAADRFASVGSVCGPLAFEPLRPSRPISVIHFHGTADQFTPFLGGKGPRSISQGHAFRSVEQTIAAWVEINECLPTTESEQLHAGEDDGMAITRTRYTNEVNGTEVVLYVIQNGGHTWPGRVPTLEVLGPSTLKLPANDLLWEFFTRHPLGEPEA